MTREMGMRFPLYPDDVQIGIVEQSFGNVRYAYNQALSMLKRAWDIYGVSLKTNDVKKLLPVMKKAHPWLALCDSTALQNAVRDNGRAFDNFFSNVRKGRVVGKKKTKSGHVKNPYGYPQFKRKYGSKQSYRSQNANGASIRVVDDRHVVLPKLGEVKCRVTRKVEGRILAATVSRDACGKYWVTLHVECADACMPRGFKPVMGVDVGVKTLACRSDGVKHASPKALACLDRKLKREQRRLSKKVKGSANYAKQKRKLAHIHAKIANVRNDAIHKATTSIVRESQAVAVEDLNVKGMMANHKLARSVADASLGEVLRQLEYKCRWYGRGFVKVGRFFPSSKLCHACGEVNGDLTLSDREWACPSCGARHDRDYNAAVNIEREGARLLNEMIVNGTAGHAGSAARLDAA